MPETGLVTTSATSPGEAISPVLLFNSLARLRGGRTRAQLDRALALAAECGTVHFVVLRVPHYQHREVKALRKAGRIAPQASVHLFGDWVEQLGTRPPGPLARLAEPARVLAGVKVRKGKVSRRVRGGRLVAIERYQYGRLLYAIDRFDRAERRIARDMFSTSTGRKIRTIRFDAATGAQLRHEYYSWHGKPVLSVEIGEKETEGRTDLLVPLAERSDAKNSQAGLSALSGRRQFSCLDDLRAAWLTGLLRDLPTPVLFCDERIRDRFALDAAAPSATPVIAFLHNNHRKAPYTSGCARRPTWRVLADAVDEFGAVAMATDSQLADFRAEVVGDRGNLVVIAHPAPTVAATLPTPSPDKYRVAMLVRLDYQKWIDSAIHAFAEVVRDVPEARLDIFGRGPEGHHLAALIADLGLTDAIRLRGFTSDPLGELRRATLTLHCARFEGFGLAVMESLAAGTPVVTYDTPYGPSEIVRDGVDGVIVPYGDVQALAKATVDLLRDPERLAAMRARAPEVVRRFSKDDYRRRWAELVRQVAATNGPPVAQYAGQRGR